MLGVGIGVRQHELERRCCTQTSKSDPKHATLAVLREFVRQPQSSERHIISSCCVFDETVGVDILSARGFHWRNRSRCIFDRRVPRSWGRVFRISIFAADGFAVGECFAREN